MLESPDLDWPLRHALGLAAGSAWARSSALAEGLDRIHASELEPFPYRT